MIPQEVYRFKTRGHDGASAPPLYPDWERAALLAELSALMAERDALVCETVALQTRCEELHGQRDGAIWLALLAPAVFFMVCLVLAVVD